MNALHPMRLGFAGNRLRRDGELRNASSLSEALSHPDAKVYVTSGNQWALGNRNGRLDPAFSVAEASELLNGQPIELLLGHDASGRPVLAASTGEASSFGHDPAPTFVDLRTLGMDETLDTDTEGQLAQAAHLLNWHANARFCGRCGAATTSEAAGFRRRCTACDHLVFPRTDPVSIMLVHDGRGRCVLGRQPQFNAGMWSCLAGFVEAGETLEDAVRRETLEEAGLRVDDVRYHSSQPWPFPGSLMIGCLAQTRDETIAFDSNELENCRWFARDEVLAMLERRHPEGLTIPPRYAIAHHLINAFILSM